MLEAESDGLGLQLHDVPADHAVVEEDGLVHALEPRHLQNAVRIEGHVLAEQRHRAVERPPVP